ncbi:MAG: hypothetical protein IBX43_07685 [Campylobacterales bacterium]|nr:hypothetical protein [Campylobacterales bacterium]
MEVSKSVQIEWNEGIDIYMTHAKSSDPLLESFFSVKEWVFVRHLYCALIQESGFDYADRSVEFEEKSVILADSLASIRLDKSEFIAMAVNLFDIVIVGANNDHHSVRYEPWWHEFTESAYQLSRTAQIL